MKQTLQFKISLGLLMQYLAWRDAQHTPIVILKVLYLIKGMNPHDITLALTEAPNFMSFMTKLRHDYGYSWLTAREGVILFNLAVLQNRYPVNSSLITQLDKDNENPNFSTNFPEVAQYAVARPAVGEPKKSVLSIKAAKAAKITQWRIRKRLSLQRE